MTERLKKYFPMIRTKAEVWDEIRSHSHLSSLFDSWTKEQQQEFLDYVTGMKGVKILYDSFFKAIMNPETVPERLESFLSVVLNQKVKIRMLSATKILKKYIRLYCLKKAPASSINFRIPSCTHISDSGLKIELLQEYLFIPLDIFRQNLQNRGIKTIFDAWLAFLCVDDPVMIEILIKKYPEFVPMYRDIYEICRNTERMMGLYSEELKILDKNTVQLMIDEMQDTIDEQKGMIHSQEVKIHSQEEKIGSQELKITSQEQTITSQEKTIDTQKEQLEQKDLEIQELKRLLASKNI